MPLQFLIPAALALTLIAGCATDGKTDMASREAAIAMLKRDFQTRGIASAERVNEDELQALCNRTGNHPSPEDARAMEQKQAATIRYPTDGNYLGDWKEGEKLAQSGRGFTWTDKPGEPNGGNCYNCHRISSKELSFGTVGPSLNQFGKLRGNGAEVQKYVYGKIYNAKAFNVCSEMPRFGHIGALEEKQIKHLVALLLDPESPANK